MVKYICQCITDLDEYHWEKDIDAEDDHEPDIDKTTWWLRCFHAGHILLGSYHGKASFETVENTSQSDAAFASFMIVLSPKLLLGQSSHVWYFFSLVKLAQYWTLLHWSNHLMHMQGPCETRIRIWVCIVCVQNLDHKWSLFLHDLSFVMPMLCQHMNTPMIILCQIWLIWTGSCSSCSSQNSLMNNIISFKLWQSSENDMQDFNTATSCKFMSTMLHFP